MSNTIHQNHPFHMVTNSPWPLISSLEILNIFLSMIQWFYFKLYEFFLFNLLIMILISFQWWRDVVRESTFQGFHTKYVSMNIRYGMIMFIISELFFFISFFWTFFHMYFSPSPEIGMIWPPKGIIMFNPYNIPLLNSIILVTSGLTITLSHHSLILNKKKSSLDNLMLTIILGIYFSLLQMFEYNESMYTINDSIFGSIFFMMTGFHGIHVIIGTIFLIICFIRMNKLHFSNKHHLGFEASAWYWHFVDIIWLFLYTLIYWWIF